MICMIDNYDSFTYNIVNYVRNNGEELEIFNNDSDYNAIDFAKYSGIILSPGPSSPDKSGITLDVIRNIKDIPLFGVCLGMQAMGLALGGEIIHAQKTMHGKVDTVTHKGSAIFKEIPETFTAVRYHSLAVSDQGLPQGLVVTARSSDNEVMAIEHNSRPLYGVQFHPESYLSEYGMKIIKNFIEVCDEYKRTA